MKAQREGDHEEMKIFATQIRKFHGDLGLPLTEFDIFTEEEMNAIDMENDEFLKEIWYCALMLALYHPIQCILYSAFLCVYYNHRNMIH